MRSKFSNNIKYILLIIVLSLFIFSTAEAVNINDSFGGQLNKVQAGTQYNQISDPTTALPIYIGILIAWTGILGIIMIVQLVMAGDGYMTAQGDAEKVLNAKKKQKHFIIAAIVIAAGLIIATTIIAIFSNVTGYPY